MSIDNSYMREFMALVESYAPITTEPKLEEAEPIQPATEHPVIADLRDLAFKLRSHMETDDNAELAMGIEQGFERAADMIDNLIRRHTD